MSRQSPRAADGRSTLLIEEPIGVLDQPDWVGMDEKFCIAMYDALKSGAERLTSAAAQVALPPRKRKDWQ